MEIYDHFNEQEFKNQVINVRFHQKWRDYEDWLQKYGARLAGWLRAHASMLVN